MREVNARIMNREVRLEDNGREWSVNTLVYANDTVLTAESRKGLARLVREFVEVCGRRKVRVTVSKSKVMVMSKDGGYKGRYMLAWRENGAGRVL